MHVAGYVDIGADVSMVTPELGEKIRGAVEANAGGEVGATALDGLGGTIDVTKAITAPVAANEKDMATVDLYVGELPSGLELILGRDWLTACGAVIDTRQNEIRLFSTTIKCELGPPGQGPRLVQCVRSGPRQHLSVPAAVEIGKAWSGSDVLVSVRPRGRNRGYIFPVYVAKVDKTGRVPLLATNPTARHRRLRPGDVTVDWELLAPTVAAAVVNDVNTVSNQAERPSAEPADTERQDKTNKQAAPTTTGPLGSSQVGEETHNDVQNEAENGMNYDAERSRT